MKLWEVLKALEENPEKKFQHESLDQEAFVSGGLLIKKGEKRKLIYLHNWQEIKQPVTWQQALEATMNDRKVTFFLEGFTYGFKKDSEISPEQIAKATWYIEK